MYDDYLGKFANASSASPTYLHKAAIVGELRNYEWSDGSRPYTLCLFKND